MMGLLPRHVQNCGFKFVLPVDSLISELGYIGVSHIFREGNDMADYLAKMGCAREVPLWEWCP